MLHEAFMVRALIAALLLAPLCSLLGVFVTARRMAFFSDTVAHAGLLGVAIAYYFGLSDSTIPMLLVGIVVAGLLLWLRERTEVPPDTLMAMLLAGSVSSGIIMLSRLKARPVDIHGFLFGDIMAVGPGDLVAAGLLFAAVVLGVMQRLNELSLITLDEDMAHVSGISVKGWNWLFVLVLTLTVALSIRLLGIVLVTSLLVVPSAAARNLSRSLRGQILGSVLVGLVGGFSGTWASYHLDVPCGPLIVLVAILIFCITLIISHLRPRS